MKIKKEFAILFFVIAVLAFYISSEKSDKTHYELPQIEKLQTADITKMKIRQTGSEISLVREGGQWRAGEKGYPADSAIVENMLKEISGLTLTALASESKNYAIYELDGDGKIDVEAYNGESPVRSISIGKAASSFRHTFVMVDDDHRIYHAEGNLKNEFDTDIARIRDKTVMLINDEISELILKKEGKELNIVRAEPPVSIDVTEDGKGEEKPLPTGPKWITAEGGAVKESEVDGIISTLKKFACDEFIEDRAKDDFNNPVFTALLKGGTDTYTITLYEKKDDKYPGVSSGSEYPFLISEWKAERIMKDFGAMREEVK